MGQCGEAKRLAAEFRSSGVNASLDSPLFNHLVCRRSMVLFGTADARALRRAHRRSQFSIKSQCCSERTDPIRSVAFTGAELFLSGWFGGGVRWCRVWLPDLL